LWSTGAPILQGARRAGRTPRSYRLRWLDVAEIELSAFTKQCLTRRISDIKILRREAKAWADARNAAQTGVDWQFTNDDARIKLKHLYPQVTLK
jgi:hypothetical protein